jgi:hypothetical protein
MKCTKITSVSPTVKILFVFTKNTAFLEVQDALFDNCVLQSLGKAYTQNITHSMGWGVVKTGSFWERIGMEALFCR